MTDLFTGVKAAVSITDVMSTYGVSVLDNVALCPFHSEKTPSMRIYPVNNSFYCFSCGSGGTVIDFAAQMFGLSPLDAARKLDEDFRLGLSGQKLTETQRREIEERRADEKRRAALLATYEAWETGYIAYLHKTMDALRNFRDENDPGRTGGEFTQDFAFAVNMLVTLDYHLETLCYGDAEDKAGLYAEVKGRKGTA